MENTLRDWIGIGRDLCEASGLMHDIGKASRHFDAKLRGRLVVAGDDVRHEWLSMKLLQAMRGNGRDWSAAWSHLRAGLSSVTLGNRRIGSHSSLGVTDALEAIDWLIVSHHGLFHAQQNSSAANGNPMCPSAAPRHVRREPCDDQAGALRRPSLAGRRDLATDLGRLFPPATSPRIRCLAPEWQRAILVRIGADRACCAGGC